MHGESLPEHAQMLPGTRGGGKKKRKEKKNIIKKRNRKDQIKGNG